MLLLLSMISDNTENYKQFINFPNVLVYNKSNTIVENINSITIPKLGHHAHSLYHYIYYNYDNLDDYIIFISLYTELYGNINCLFSTIFIEKIWYYIENSALLNIQFETISNYKVIVNTNSILNLSDPETQYLNPVAVQNVFKTVYSNLFGYFEVFEYEYGEGMNYVLSKEIIRSRPKQYYLSLLNFLENDDTNAFYERNFIESFTEKIFTDNFTSFNSYEPVIEEPVIEEPVIEEPVVEEDIDNFDINYEFNKPYICFRPSSDYCDNCNKIDDVIKPDNHNLMCFCSPECQEHYNKLYPPI